VRFQKKVPTENRKFLTEQLKSYIKEMPMTKEERKELEKWVSSGRSPYDNGDYIYSDGGYPLDFVSAMRVQQEEMKWFNSLSEKERAKYLQETHDSYDTEIDSVIHKVSDLNLSVESDEELPFS